MTTENKITIRAQHLTGNSADGFNDAEWVSALEQKYLEIARACYPDAEIKIDIDVQPHSGYCRGVEVDGDDNGLITFQIEQAANALYDSRGEEFYESDEQS